MIRDARRVYILMLSLLGILSISPATWADSSSSAISPPPVGGFYVDSLSGAQVTTLGPTGWTHQWSGATPVSAHNRYALLTNSGLSNSGSGSAEVVNAATGLVVYSGIPLSTEFTAWDANDDDLYYYISGTQVRSHRLSTGADAAVVDYAADAHHFTAITAGGSSDTSSDNWMAFRAPNENQVCALNLTSVQTYCANYMAADATAQTNWEKLDSVLTAKGVDSATGKRYVLMTGSPAWGMWSVDETAGVLDFETLGPQNTGGLAADLLADSDGRQYLVTTIPQGAGCGLDLATMPLSTRVYSSVLALAACGQTAPGVNIGCARKAPYCAISTYSTSTNQGDHRVLLMRGNGEQIEPLMNTNSVLFTADSYWPRYYEQPRTALSPDGSLAVFDSDFGVALTSHASVATTGVASAPVTQADTRSAAKPESMKPKAMTLTLTPATVTLSASQAQQFTLKITDGLPGVTWSLSANVGTIAFASSSGSSSSSTGTFSTTTTYTAPASITTAQQVTVTATSIWNKNILAQATVTLHPAPSGITGLTVLGTSPTQALVAYNAPNTTPCSFTVNQGSAYSTNLVPDVNPALFAGANSDSRAGSISNGTARIVVIGQRTAQQSSGGTYYSRALQNDTQHFFQVTCSGVTASTTFTTQNPQFGNMYPEPPAADPSHPGAAAWPTITSQTTSTIDPETGVAMYPLGFGAQWPAGAHNIMCSLSTVTSSDKKQGYVCMTVDGDSQLFFVDRTDGIYRNIGTFSGVVYGTFSGDTTDSGIISESTFWSGALGHFYALNWTTNNYPVILQGTYQGGWQNGDLSVSWSNLTPHSAGKDVFALMQSFDSRFNATLNAGATQIGLSGDEKYIIIEFLQGVQNSTGWLGIFDPTNTSCGAAACPIAAAPIWLSSACRWCGFHTLSPVAGEGAHVLITPSSNIQSNGYWPMDSGYPNNGDGPWLTQIASGQLTATPAYPAGAPIPGFPGLVAPANGADVITVAGQPCDPTPGNDEPGNCPNSANPSWHFLMNVQVGDHFMMQDMNCGTLCEQLAIIGINGNTWAVQRGIPNSTCLACQAPLDHTGVTTLGMLGTVDSESYGMEWDFASDPHGTGSGMAPDLYTIDHFAYTVNEAGGGGAWYNCPTDENQSCVQIKTGADMSYIGQPATVSIPEWPNFAGTATGSGAYVEYYVSGAPVAPVIANPDFVTEARPIENGASNWNSLSGSIYQVTGSIGTYNPKLSAVLAACGGVPMRDVSSAATASSGAVASLATPYTYCYAKNNGECFGGSTAGNWYANCSVGVGDNTQTYLMLDAATHAKISQVRWDDVIDNGRNIRPITTSFRPLSKQSSFWSGRAPASGNFLLTYSDNANFSGQSAVFAVTLPPLPTWDGIDRTTWVPVNVTAAGGHGTAVVQFGYAENGPYSSFYCSSRQEACQVAESTIQSTPYYYASESITPLPCASGCTIQIPGISGRTVYYQIRYSDGTKSAITPAIVQ